MFLSRGIIEIDSANGDDWRGGAVNSTKNKKHGEHSIKDGLRLSLFIILVSFMALGPFYRQILGGDNNLFRPWVMFKGKGVGIIDARHFIRNPEGAELELDRYVTLGIRQPRQSPSGIYKIKRRAQLKRLNRRLCNALPPQTDLRLYARQMRRTGWRVLEQGQRNICSRRG